MFQEKTYDQRLESTVNTLIQFARGNFEPRLELADTDDNLNVIRTGLNMLGDELQGYKTELDTKNQFLETILNTIDQIVYVINTNPQDTEHYMRYTFVSAPIERLLGYKPEDILAESYSLCQSVYFEDKQTVLDSFYSAMATGQPTPCTYRVVHKHSGDLVWMEDRMVPEKNKTGQVIRIIGSAKDITERKRAEENLLEQKKFTERILCLLPIDVVVLDKEHRYTFLNPAAVSDPEMRRWLIGRDDFDYCHRRQLPVEIARQRREKFEEARCNGADLEWLDTYATKNGETKHKLRRFLPIIENGVFKYTIGYGVDITDLKKTAFEKEKLLKELNNKVNELMQFNYIVSHNLRSPVASILGLTSLLEHGLPDDERDKAIRYLNTASTAIDSTIKDLNLILASRSLLNEKVERFCLSSIINEVRNHLAQQIKDSGAIIQLQVLRGNDQLCSIRSYIQSVMHNLLSNAIKYKSPDRHPVISIDVSKENEQTCITVQDNGMGIDLEKFGKQIFGLYKRFDLKTEGKGLGLYMSKMQLESLGGSIAIDSRPGHGTQFTIRL